jgi:aspartate aminotransferase
MLAKDMLALGTRRSVIREIFEFGKKRAAEVGPENVFDFSIGNPSIPAPACVKKAILELLDTEDPCVLHGYTSAQGDPRARRAIADYVNKTHGVALSPDDIYMTCGAAASLIISLKAMCVAGDEFISFAPYFPEYKVFVEAVGGKFVVIPPDAPRFQIGAEQLRRTVSEHTKAVIINSPNNPSGVIYSAETLKSLAAVLEEKEREYGHSIYLIADEPYRELVYDKNITVPYPMKFYKNTIVCYSYSKSLSLPGERIGYIAVSPEMEGSRDMYFAICGAGRALGYVCAPSMFQLAVAKCQGQTGDLEAYKANRDLLYDGLTKLGYECVHPDGAFYLFVKSPEADDEAFCEKAKKYDLLLVAGAGFGAPGYVRLAYCVKKSMIERSMPAFAKLIREYR